MDNQVVWTPQPGPQTAAISCPVEEIFYGGARGGGKTDAAIGDFLSQLSVSQGQANGVFFRRTSKQLEEVVARTKAIFPKLGASYRDQKGQWDFPSGDRLKFRYLERDSDAENYQGHSYTWVGIEEVTNFPDQTPIDKLRATLRHPTVPKRMFLTGNPGGPGHRWVKKRYVDPAPQGYQVIEETLPGAFGSAPITMQRIFIPSKLSDNRILLDGDPAYVARLQQQGSKALIRAWLAGDWSVPLGAFFDTFSRSTHVLESPMEASIPREALRFRAMDWGSARPFSIGWYAFSDGSWGLPRGALFKYREWYGAPGGECGRNLGLKMHAEDVARGVLNREAGEAIEYGAADPSIYIEDGGPSIAESMLIQGCVWQRADNKRKSGWAMLRRYLEGNGTPLIYFSETCQATISTLESLVHDEADMEDVDTDAEDHAADETRYACMSRPWLPNEQEPRVENVNPYGLRGPTISELAERHIAARRQEREEITL